MSESDYKPKRVTAQDIRAWYAPIKVETVSHGPISLTPFGADSHYRAVASAVDDRLDDLSQSKVVLNALQEHESGEQDSDLAIGDWNREDLARLLPEYMAQPRSRLTPPNPSEDVLESFARQCRVKLDAHTELGKQIFSTIQKTYVPFQGISDSILRMPILFDAYYTNPLMTAAQQIVDSQRTWTMAIESTVGASRKHLLDISSSMSSLADSLVWVQPNLMAFNGFWRQTAELWKSIDKWLVDIQQRIERDKKLRALGIDVERLRFGDVTTWLSLVYSVLETNAEVEAASQAILELTNSETFRSEITRRLEVLPEPVRTLRTDAISQGLEAHRSERYIISCTVLMAQLDGLVGDILVELEAARGARRSRRRDFGKRIRALEELTDPEHAYPSVLASHFGVVDPPFGMEDENTIGFDRVRHNIMHGHPDAPYCKEQSAKIIFMILSLLTQFVSEDDDLI